MTHPARSTVKLQHPDELQANPAPLGMIGLGLTLILFALVQSGLLPMEQKTFGTLLFAGGSVQIISGLCEWRQREGFGATAFLGLGFFWLSLIALFVYPQVGYGHVPHPSVLASYLIMWAFFTGILFLGTLRLSRTLRIAFALLACFQLGCAAGLATGQAGLQAAAGYQGAICGALFLLLAAVKMSSEKSVRELAFEEEDEIRASGA